MSYAIAIAMAMDFHRHLLALANGYFAPTLVTGLYTNQDTAGGHLIITGSHPLTSMVISNSIIV